MNSSYALAERGCIVVGYLKGFSRFKVYLEFNLRGLGKACAVLGDVGRVKRG